MIVLGIDPGMSGAMCGIKTHHSVAPIVGYRLADRAGGYMGKPIDEQSMHRALLDLREELGGGRTVIVLEQQRAGRAPEGRGSIFKTGHQFGIWCGILTTLGLPYAVLRAQEWRKVAGITVGKGGDPKAATIAHVRRVLPDLDLVPTARSRNAHDGLADAAGMALCARALVGSGRL